MSNKQQRGKLTELTRQEAEDNRIVILMKYNMQNGFLNWGKLEMEMECDDLTWKKVLKLTQYSDRLLSFVLNKLSLEILQELMIGQFSRTSKTERILNKTFSSRHLPN